MRTAPRRERHTECHISEGKPSKSGFRVVGFQGFLGFRVWGSRFRVQGFSFYVGLQAREPMPKQSYASATLARYPRDPGLNNLV